MIESNVPSADDTGLVVEANQENKVQWSEWALAVLLTVLIGLSAAALLVTSIMELIFDTASAWVRIGVLLPVLLIASYLLIQLWLKLIHRRSAAKK